MVELKKDKKGPTWIVSKIDAEGFSRQINLTDKEMTTLIGKYLAALHERFV